MPLRFGFGTLPLGDAFEPDLVLVRWHDAQRFVREGGYRLGIRGYHEHRAMSAVFDLMRTGDSAVRRFVMESDTAYGFDLHRYSDHDVMDVVRNLLSGGRFVVIVRDDRATAAASAQGPMQKALAAYDTFSARFGKEFTVASRKLRLTSRDQVAVILQSADYDAVPKAEAIGIVLGLVADARTPNLIAAAKTIAESLLDLRDPPNKEGFVLLRAPFALAAQSLAPEDLITPAKLKQMKEGTYVGFLLLDEGGFALPGMRLLVKPADEVAATIISDEKGGCRLANLKPGTCRVDFVDFVEDLHTSLDMQTEAQNEKPWEDEFDANIQIHGANEAGELPDCATGKVHRLTIRTWVDVLIATDVSESSAKTSKASFCLSSKETGYSRTLYSGDDAILDSGWVELLFQDVPRHGNYKLTSTRDGRTETMFDAAPGKRLGHAMTSLQGSPPETQKAAEGDEAK